MQRNYNSCVPSIEIYNGAVAKENSKEFSQKVKNGTTT